MGYRNDHTTGLALDDEPESIYAVMGGDHYNDVCCTKAFERFEIPFYVLYQLMQTYLKTN